MEISLLREERDIARMTHEGAIGKQAIRVIEHGDGGLAVNVLRHLQETLVSRRGAGFMLLLQVNDFLASFEIGGDKLGDQFLVRVVKILSADINVRDGARQLGRGNQHARSFDRAFGAAAGGTQTAAQPRHVRRDGETRVDVSAFAKQLRRRITGAGQFLGPNHLDIIPRQPGRFQNVVQHPDVRPSLLERNGFALQVRRIPDVGPSNHVIARGPCHLQNDHAFRARIRADDFRSQAHHVKRAAQERAFPGAVVAHLLHEIVTSDQPQVQLLFLEKRAGLCRQSSVRIERRHVAAPGDVRNLQR